MRSRQHRQYVPITEREIFFNNKESKFAVECDWNSKISQNVQNSGFIEKVDGFSEKKNNFGKPMYFFSENPDVQSILESLQVSNFL